MAYKSPTFQEATAKPWQAYHKPDFDPKTIGPKTREVYETAKREGRQIGGSYGPGVSVGLTVASARLLTEKSNIKVHPYGAGNLWLILARYERRTQGINDTPTDFKSWDARLGQELGDLCNEIGDAVLEDLGFTYEEAQERHALYSKLAKNKEKKI